MNKICPACGAESPANYNYCGFCAHPFDPTFEDPANPAPAVEQRSALRLVTVLFADLTNFTHAAAHVEAEETFEIARTTLEQISQAITHWGGQIDRYIGDGFLATFGTPEVHEDDPKRALKAALDMQQALEKLKAETNQKPNWDAQLRIGIHTGPVVRGQLDTGSLTDASVFGQVINLANRLQNAARPGTILVSEAIYRQVRSSFIFSEALPLNLRGLDKPVLGYEVTRQRPTTVNGRGLTDRDTSLVGRTAEADAMITAMQRLQIERLGVSMLITGEAGVGKSRLVQEVLAPATEHFNIIRTECSATETGSYSLLRAILTALIGITADHTSPERRQRLEDVLARSATLAREIGPGLSDILQTGDTSATPTVDPQQEQRRLFGATRRLIAWMARRQPLVLVLDDLQWADASSLEAISHFADLILDAPLAIIAIARPAAHANLIPILKRDDPDHPDNFLDFQINALSKADSDRLLTLMLADVPVPPALQKSLLDRGAGNPLLMEEMIRMLLDQKVIYKTEAGWAVSNDWAQTIRQVPDTVNGLILNRYDRLPSHFRQILDVAAVFKRHFSLAELSAIADVPEAILNGWVNELEHLDIFRPVSDTSRARYAFRHPLLGEAIYQTLLQPQRQGLHLKVAHVIQQLAGDGSPDTVELIAFHLEQGQSPLAGTYLLRAATRAAARYANQEAIDYYHRLQSLADGQSNTRQAVDVALGLGELMVRVGQPETATEELEKALQLASHPELQNYHLGDIWFRLAVIQADRGLHREAATAFENAAAILATHPETCQTFSASDLERELGWDLCNQAQFSEAKSHATLALEEALDRSDQAALGSAYNLCSAVAFYRGELQEAVTNAIQALSIREQRNDVWGSASTQTNLGTLYYKLGQWPLAESYLRQAIFVQQEIGDHYTLGLSRNTLSLLLLASGRLDEALLLLDQALTAFNTTSEPSPLACMLLMNRGLAYSRLGQAEPALQNLEQSLDLTFQLNNENLRTLALAYLAEANLASGNLAHAHLRLEQATTLERATPSPGNLAEIARIQSEVHQADLAWTKALAANRLAASLFRQLDEKHEFARSQAGWAHIELAWQSSEPQHVVDPDCYPALVEAAEIFKSLRAQADIIATDALLTRLISELGDLKDKRLDTTRPFVVAINIQLRVPAYKMETAEVAMALQALVNAVKKTGQGLGAITTSRTAELTFIFSASDPAEADILMLKAVQCAVAARDAAARVNVVNRLKFDLEISPSIGLSASLWQAVESSASKGTLPTQVIELEKRAERLALQAPANQIYLSPELASAIGLLYSLETIASPPDQIPTSVVFQLGQARSNSGLTQQLPGPTNQLIGRNLELAALRAWIDRSRQLQEGQVCYVEAEAGMGKTRLQAEAIAYAQPNVTCLVGKCELHRNNISFWAFSNMLATAEITETNTSRRLKIVLGLLPPDQQDEVMLQSLSPANLRQELFGRLREFLLQEAAQKPILLIIEDIHWLDLSSLDLLDFLLPIIREARISILMTARAEMAGPHRSLLSKAERICGERYLQIKFSGLTDEDSLALVRQMLNVPTLPRGLGRMLQAYAGHPLSLEEAVRHLMESGHLRRADNRWLLTEMGGEAGRELPTTYEDLLLARLETLDSEALHVLQAAATLGESVDQSLLNAIVPGPEVASRLSELVERGWLLPPEANNPLAFRFKHTLTRETIHATLLTSKNRILHQRAGEAIENLYPDALEGQIEVLAYHFSHSSQRDKAANYLIQAAEKSAARQALAESLGYYQEATEALKHNQALQTQLGPRLQLGLADVYLALGIPVSAIGVIDDLRNNQADLTPDLQGAARQRQAAALRKSGQLREALATYETARDLLQGWMTANQSDSPVMVKNAVTRELLAIQIGLAQTLFDMHENNRAAQQIRTFLAEVERDHFPDQIAQALDLQGGIAYRLNQGEAALQAVQESLSIYQMTGNRAGAAAAYANLGILSVNINQPNEATDYFGRSLTLREALGDIQGLAITRNNLGQLLVRQGRFAEAVQEFGQAGQFARRAGLRQLLTQSLSNHGYALTLLGDPAEALPILREAEKLCTSFSFKNLLCETLWKRAECHLEAHEMAAAESAARLALSQAVALESNDLQSEARRVLSRIARRNNLPAPSLTEASTAWNIRQLEGNPILRSRFAAEYGLALAANGQRAEAQDFMGEHVSVDFAYMSQPYLEEIKSILNAN